MGTLWRVPMTFRSSRFEKVGTKGRFISGKEVKHEKCADSSEI